MNKQKKQMFIVLILLVVAVALYFIIPLIPQKEEEIVNVSTPINTINSTQVTKISFTGSEEFLSFVKTGDVWVLEGYEDREVDTSTLNEALRACCSITTYTKIENVTDYSQFGFNEPTNVVSIEADGETHTITYGSFNSVSSVYYIMMDSDPAISVYSHSQGLPFDNSAEYFLNEPETEETETDSEMTESEETEAKTE